MPESLSYELPKQSPEQLINEAIMSALSRVILRKTKPKSTRGFTFSSIPSHKEMQQKIESNLEGMCMEMSLNICFELLLHNKAEVEKIFIVNSYMGKGAYKENPDFIAHSYVIVKIGSAWFAVSGANYQASKIDNFLLIKDNTLEGCLQQITEISGSQWPEASDFPASQDVLAYTKENDENKPDSTDLNSGIAISIIQKNPTHTFSETKDLQVFQRRLYSDGRKKISLFSYDFTEFWQTS